MHWLIIILVIAVLIYFGYRNSKKRQAETAAVAAQLGLTHQASGVPFAGFERCGIHLFTEGTNHASSNLLSGTADGLEVRVFDYAYEHSNILDDDNSQSTTMKQTVAAFHSEGGRLPDFRVAPTGLLSKVGRGLQKDILLDGRAVFNKKYHLKGTDADAVRQIFTPNIVSMFESHDHKHRWNVEGCGDWIVVFRERSVVKPAEIGAFLQSATQIASTVLSGAAADSRA